MISDGAATDDALLSYKQLLRTLHRERARRGIDPWTDSPLTMPQLRALSIIVAEHDGLSSRALASRLGVGASAVTPLVDRLVERGLVERHEDARDRRIARLYATDFGSALVEQLLAGRGDVIREAMATLSENQLKQVAAAFDVLRAAIERTTQTQQESES